MNVDKRRLFLNTALLTVTSLLIRLIGMWFNGFLVGKIGPEGIGVYHLILSVYGFCITIAASGIRLSATRLSAEDLAKGNSPRHALTSCMRLGGFMGLIACALLFVLSKPAALLIRDAGLVYPLRLLSPALPFLAMSSALGGYFTARRKIWPYGVVQVMEQVLRVLITVLVLKILPENEDSVLIAVAISITVAEMISFSCSFTACLIDLRFAAKGKSVAGIFRKIVRIALPEAAGAYLRSALSTAEQLFIPKQLARANNGENALTTYGVINGMALPILFMPSAPITALATMLLPEFAHMRATNNQPGIQRAIHRSIKIAATYAFAVAALLFIAAEPLSLLLYKSTQAVVYIRALCPLILLFYVDMMTDSLLKGLDQQLFCMRLNTLDCAMRLLLVFFLLPLGGTWAYIALLYISETFNMTLSVRKLFQVKSSQAF
jgi:stage V sporulation protein B